MARGGEEVLDELLGLVRDIHRKQLNIDLDAWGDSAAESAIARDWDRLLLETFAVGQRVLIPMAGTSGTVEEVERVRRLGGSRALRYFIRQDDGELVWNWATDVIAFPGGRGKPERE
jgi:hypothetical protein